MRRQIGQPNNLNPCFGDEMIVLNLTSTNAQPSDKDAFFVHNGEPAGKRN